MIKILLKMGTLIVLFISASAAQQIEEDVAYLCTVQRAVFYNIETEELSNWTGLPKSFAVFLGRDDENSWLNLMTIDEDMEDVWPFTRYFGEEPFWINQYAGQVIYGGGSFLTFTGLKASPDETKFGSWTMAATCSAS